MYYWFIVHSTTGAVGAGSATHAPDAGMAPNGWELLGAYATLDATQQAIYANPTRYLYQNNEFVLQPYFTASASVTSGTTTLAVSLNNPPGTPPTSATATIGTSTITIPLTNNSGTLPVQLHETLLGYSVPVAISATGAVGATATVGTGPQPTVSVQAIAPTTGGDPYVIGPVGSGSLGFIAALSLGIDPIYADIATAIMNMAEATTQVQPTSPSAATPWTTMQSQVNNYQTTIGSLPGLA